MADDSAAAATMEPEVTAAEPAVAAEPAEPAATEAAASEPATAAASAEATGAEAPSAEGEEESAAAEGKERKKKKEHKHKKEKKHKKHKKHKKEGGDDAAAAAAGGAEGDAEAAAAGSGAEGSSSSSSSSDSDDDGADADEKARKRDRRRRRKEKKKAAEGRAEKKRHKRKGASKFLDLEVEVSSDEEVSADEDGGGDDSYLADLVVPDEEMEKDNEDALRAERRRKKGKRIREEDLAEDDLLLVKEHLGLETRPNIDADVQKSSDEEQEAAAPGGERKRLRKGIKDDDSRQFERMDREKREKERERASRDHLGLDDEEDDGFLAPEDDGEMMGAPAHKKKGKREDDDMGDFVEEDTKVSSAARGDDGGEMSSQNKERLRSLFGNVTSFFQGKKKSKSSSAAAADDSEAEEGSVKDEDESDDSEAEHRREIERRRRLKAATKTSSVSDRVARIAAIRAADIPERLYERHLKWTANLAGLSDELKEQERKDEAAWIFHQLFRNPNSPFFPKQPAPSQYGYQQPPPAAKDPLVLCRTIEFVLHQLHEEHLEMPYIALYNKDSWGGRLMQAAARLTEEELMKIDELDESWVQLGSRRKKLSTLLSEYAASPAIHEAATGLASDYATPTSGALAEWKKLLSSPEVAGSTELDDVQDAIKVVGLIEQCKKKQLPQQRRDQRNYAIKLKQERKEAERLAKAERIKQAAELKARMAAELGDSFEAGAAAAMADEKESEEKDEAEPQSDPEDHMALDEEDEVQVRGVRTNRSQFSVLSKCWSINNTPSIAAAIGLTPTQFAENVSVNYKTHDAVDGPFNVSFLAEEAIKYNKVKDVDEALVCARRYAAFLIGTNPLIRREVRKMYMEQGQVWTFPTAKGVREIDDTHEYLPVKRIEGKPISRMNEHPAQFLLMNQAEQEGFIRIEFRLPPTRDTVNRMGSMAMENPEADDITAQLCEMYLTNSQTTDGLQWNIQRRLVIHDAMKSFLVPICHAHVRSSLLMLGMEYVSGKVARKLMDMVTVAGFKPPQGTAQPAAEDDSASSSSKRKSKKPAAEDWRIFSMIVGDKESPSYLAVLNRYGRVVDHACFHFLKSSASARGRNGEALSESERQAYARKKEDIKKFLELVNSYNPKLLLLDASSMDSRFFKEDLRAKILMGRDDIRIEWHDPEVARIYMNSARAELEFKEYPRNLRQAISLGRKALDPVSEVAGLYSGPMDASQWADSANTSAQLMNSIRAGKSEDAALKSDVIAAATNALSNDTLALTLHPLQRMVPVPMLLKSMQRTLVRVVNYTGVDINKVQQRPWLSGTLQFLAGLGPIKAKLLLDYVKKRGYLSSRNDLLLSKAPVVAPVVKSEDGAQVKMEDVDAKPAASSAEINKDALFHVCVWRNCAGFVIIHANQAMESTSEQSAHPLDETRIHPDLYTECTNIVVQLFEVDDKTIAAEVDKRFKKEKRKQAPGSDDEEDDRDDDDEEGNNAASAASAGKKAKSEARDDALRARILQDIHERYLLQGMEPANIKILNTLDLESYVEDETVPRWELFTQMKAELISPFGDYNKIFRPFTAPSPAQLFFLLTGETSRTLREGMLTHVTVNGIHPGGKGAYVKMDSGIRGFLSMRNVSDNAPQGGRRDQDPQDAEREAADNVNWLKARLAPGLSVNARVLKVEKEKFMVELSTKSSDLNQQQWVANAGARAEKDAMIAAKFGRSPAAEEPDDLQQDLYFFEPYLFKDATHPDDNALLLSEAGPQKAVARFRQRNITHTLFRNFSRDEAIAFLRDKPIGDVLVRPSTQGTHHLTLTWKVSNEDQPVDPMGPADAVAEKGFYFHVDIRELNKPNELEVGTRLLIGGSGEDSKYSFEDLDEIVARFITPMKKWIDELVRHKSFRYGGDAEIANMLYAEKQQDRSGKIPYVLHFATARERQGAFQFSFLPNTTVKSSSLVVVPEGYSYHDHVYRSLPALLSAVKVEMSTRVGIAPPAGSQRAAAAASKHAGSSRSQKTAVLPPYAAAPAASAASVASASRPPYAAAPSSNVLPPYAGAAAAAVPAPYAAQPPRGAPAYAGANMPYGGPQQPPQQPYQPSYGGGMPLPPQPQPGYGQYQPPPQQQPRPSYQQPPSGYPMPPQPQQPQQQPRYAPPPAPAAAAGAPLPTSGYVHPSRLGIVAHPTSAPQQQPQQPPQGYPPAGQLPMPPSQPRASRWGGTANTRNDDMQM